MKRYKFIFITGGVISSLGKGIATSSIGRILKDRGFKVTLLKIDPYINVDPGTLSPYQHGEVFVTIDGGETDLDLGHYERFVDINLKKINNFTTGQIYNSVIQKERRGDYNGKTVQVVPHIIDEIIDRIKQVPQKTGSEILITELGGTIGDIESQPFTEAIRQIKLRLNKENFLLIHLVLVPYIKTAGELKTKPAQHSVKKLNELGLQPDIILCRTEKRLPKNIREKISLFTNVENDAVINAVDAETLYEIPLNLKKEGLDKIIMEKLNLTPKKDNNSWNFLVKKVKSINKELNIGLVGKYIELHDAYISIAAALEHSGIANDVKVNIKWINAEKIEEEGVEALKGLGGIIVPGGFGERGVEGKITTIKHVRENNIPFLGICLGMQCAVIEYARNVLKLPDAHSSEFKPNCKSPVIDIMEDKKNLQNIGGTLRLGGYKCELVPGTLASKIYNKKEVIERHRHRYEFNNKYREVFEKNGMIFSGIYKERNLVEIVEIPEHPFFIGVQFHPEFQSRPENPHPIFREFVKASLQNAN